MLFKINIRFQSIKKRNCCKIVGSNEKHPKNWKINKKKLVKRFFFRLFK